MYKLFYDKHRSMRSLENINNVTTRYYHKLHAPFLFQLSLSLLMCFACITRYFSYIHYHIL